MAGTWTQTKGPKGRPGIYVQETIINSLPSGPDPDYRGENPEEAGREWNYL
jgi:hypothetical protein